MGVLILGSTIVGSKYIKKALASLNEFPIFFVNLDDYSGDARRAITACEYYDVNIYSFEAVESAIVKFNLGSKITAVTSLLDEHLHIACEIAYKFKLKGPDKALLRLASKAEVYQLIPEYSPQTCIFAADQIGSQDVKDFLNKYKDNTLVLKAAISAGGVGMHSLNHPSIDMIKQFVLDAPLACQHQVQWMLQVAEMGELFSLEGFVTDGVIKFLGFSERIRDGMVEYSNIYPSDDKLSSSQKDRCYLIVSELVRRSGYQYGFFHCEFIINGMSIQLIDANMGRVAGSAIMEQISIVHDIAPEMIIQHVIDLGVFRAKYSKYQYHLSSKDFVTLCLMIKTNQQRQVDRAIVPFNENVFCTRVFPNEKGWVVYLAGVDSEVRSVLHNIYIEANGERLDPIYKLPVEL